MECRRSKRKRPNCPDQDEPANQNTEVPSEDFAEVIKFCGLSKEDNETMSDYYKRLQLQADKIGVNCCQDRIIRDRLIQAVTDKDILLEIAKMKKNPTAKDVLNEFNEIKMNQKIFNYIIPYLSLVDISALSKTSLRLQKIVYKHLQTGNPITIDDQQIHKYPLKRNTKPYMQFRHATNVTLRRVNECDISAILNGFEKIKEFTMADMTIIEDISYLPVSISDLTLISVQIEEDLFNKWILSLKDSLLRMNLDRVQQTAFGSDPDYCWTLNIQNLCPQLELLEIKGHNVKLQGKSNDLVSLNIVAQNIQCSWKDLPCLASLRLDITSPRNVANILQSISPGDWDNLQTLTLVQRIDPKYKIYIDALNVDYVNVEYSEYAGADETNQIFKVLNEDCLLNLSKYLGVQDCIALCHTSPRLRELIIKHRFLKYDTRIDSGFYFILQTNHMFVKQIAPHVKDLTIRDDSLPLLRLLKHFTVLRSLSVSRKESNIYIKNEVYVDVGTWPKDLQKIFLRLGCFTNETEVKSYLLQLENLREVTIDPVWMTKEVVPKLLLKNRNTLEHIVILYSFIQPTFSWQDVTTLPYLNHLSIESIFVTPTLPHIEKWLSIFGKGLLKLTIEFCSGLEACLSKGCELAKLQEVEVTFATRLTEVELRALCSFKELKKLTLLSSNPHESQSPNSIMQLVKSCPNLKILILSGFVASIRFGIELRGLLRKTKRVLQINGLMVK